MRSPWIIRFGERPGAELRLFCFPYAGGGASAYRGWPADLPESVEVCAVQPPGRESRLREPPSDDLLRLADRVVEGARPWMDGPFAFFGHSMGALLAFETVRALRRAGMPGPEWLFVSGRRGPRIPDPEPPLSHLPEPEFIAEIQRRFGGIPAEVLKHRELVELLLPGLRADVASLEKYAYEPGELLECPVTAVGGGSDPRATRDELQAWRGETRGPFEARTFPGGHFYLREEQREVTRLIGTSLGRLDPTGSVGWPG
jgi:medium-chain acyl-[acyl-carrier-protein] hydrolase